MERIFVDANVILEIMLRRRHYREALKALAVPDRYFVISPLTVHLCYYFCLRENVDFKAVSKILAAFEVLPMNGQTVQLAQERCDGNDFEDCLQSVCAELGGCDGIITLDKKFQKYSGTPLPVAVL
jgi:predicted nucleic acid-binding protein